MYPKLLFHGINILAFSTLIMQIFVSNVFALTCKASVGDRCTGATYCKVTYQAAAGQWIIMTQNCVWTTLPYPNGDNWSEMTSNGVTVVTYTCTSKDYCNMETPPTILPTKTPAPSPSSLQCIRKFFGGTAQSCTAISCYIVITKNITLQNCAPAGVSSSVAAAPGQQYCSKSIDSVVNNNAVPSTFCYCNTKDLCNDNSLLQWGQQQLAHVNTILCSVGTSLISSGPIGTARGQYCHYTKITYNGATAETWSAISSTLSEPPFGCIKIYGNSNPSVSCTCNSDFCNVNPLSSTTPANTALTTPPAPGTISTRTTSTSSTFPQNHTTRLSTTTSVFTIRPTSTTTQKPVTAGSLQIMLMNFDNSDGGGRLYDGSHCDSFWFAGIDQCDIALKICIEPSFSSSNVDSCSTTWIDLNQITHNKNKVNFVPGETYGGFNNPMTFYLQKAAGFHLKFFAQDVDNGNRQKIDKYSCNYSYQYLSNWGTIICQHQRPNGFMISYDGYPEITSSFFNLT